MAAQAGTPVPPKTEVILTRRCRMADQPEYSPHHRADVEVSQDGDKVTLKAPADGATLTADEAHELASRVFEASALARGEDPEESDIVRVAMQYMRLAAERLEFEGDGAPADGEDNDLQQALARLGAAIKR